MRARSTSRRLLVLLVIGLVVTLTITSPVGALSPRDPNFNGVWQDYGSGWSYCYYTATDSAQWRYGTDKLRFSYSYGPGQWFEYDYGHAWQQLGASGLSSQFIGDGRLHDLKNGWSYYYQADLDSGRWKSGATLRFTYYNSTGQWWNVDNYAGRWKLGSGLSGSFIGDGAQHDIGRGWMFSYSADKGYWGLGSTARFNYDYAAGQWWNTDYAGTWMLGNAGLSGSFVGDGAVHDLMNGWSYYYSASLDSGRWKRGASLRLTYYYGTGQWYDAEDLYGRYKLSETGAGGSFIADGSFHDLKNGWSYAYDLATDTGLWKLGVLDRFKYAYGTGQWWDHDANSAWNAVGLAAMSCSFLGDGAWHYLNNNWSYLYSAAADQSSWLYKGKLRFAYSYGAGQWFDPSTWGAIGGTGVSSAFLGDGAWHDLNSGGWSYLYSAVDDYNQWRNGTNLRFKYAFMPGQWYDYDPTTTGWSLLGAGNTSSTFVGDGSVHSLNDGWFFLYSAAQDYGEWQYGGNSRFRYYYTSAQWNDFAPTAGIWSALGAAGLSSTFLGDGALHDVYNNGSWIFSYNALQDKGYWQDQTVQRFAFDYLNGQWSDNGTFTLGWTPLGGANVASLFIGDGAWHNLNNGWDFIYAAGVGRWMDGFGERFKYDYASGQWSDLDANTVWNTLGIAGLNSQFIGDGTQYDLGLGAGWLYSYAANNGSYVFGAATRFSYDYGTGAWTDYAPTGSYQLGANLRSSTFIGDGLSHDLGTGWFYTYLADEGHWSRTSGGPSRLSYLYSSSQWFDWDTFSNKFALGASGLVAASFMGDGAWHDVTLPLGNTWWYQYNAVNDEDLWAKTNGGPAKFSYRFAAGDWYDVAPIGGSYLLGSGMTAAFIGDETVHDLLNNWRYAYAYGANEGNWSTLLTGQTRLSYNYDGGQWHQHYLANRYDLGAAGTAGQFIGDGSVHDLGVWAGVSGNWWYQYNQATDIGSWSRGQLDPVRFAYAYGPGQWSGGNAAGFFALGNAGLSPVFIGDGAAHDVTTGVNAWWYTYTYGTDTGSWAKSDILPYRFAYDYTNSQWTDNAPIGGAYALGNAGLSASFIGDGNAHALNATWQYTYNYTANEASWLKTALALTLYSYNYDAGQWYHYDAGLPYALGSGNQIASSFIGDGAWHDVTTGPNAWWYRFDGTQLGQFAKANGGTVVFAYNYPSRIWRTYGFGGSALQLGTLKLDTWVGDEAAHDMGAGWRFTYGYTTDRALFDHVGYVTQFAYDYVPGQWNHTYNSTFSALGQAGNFISNSYYDGGIYAITTGGQAAKYRFAQGNIGGAADREVGYYYGAGGTSVVGPNLAYSYYANGAADGSWALIQRSGANYLTFTEAGLTPTAVNFADGAFHTTFTGQWARARFDAANYGMVYFEMASQNAAIAKVNIRYDLNLDKWQDQWGANWLDIAAGNAFGPPGAKYFATNLASGSQLSFTQIASPFQSLTYYFGNKVTAATWPNTWFPAALEGHIIYISSKMVFDYSYVGTYNGQARQLPSTTNQAISWLIHTTGYPPSYYLYR